MVVESKTPHNMKTIKSFEVKIKENHPTEPQTWRVFLDREFTAKLRVIKKDSDTKQTVLVPNAEFVALLKQANTDSTKMAEVIGVSEAQLRFVTNTASGMGLIKCGSVVIPFDNQISKDTDLYRLYNTNIHEIIEQKKHANEKC